MVTANQKPCGADVGIVTYDTFLYLCQRVMRTYFEDPHGFYYRNVGVNLSKIPTLSYVINDLNNLRDKTIR